jgi:hypothetical protein
LTLSPGTRLGSYEIVAALGSGGMGEVYRARDVRLGRDVAVKVLASRLAGNPEAQARFEREAKAVAALSHPNIVALFDYGESDGTLFTVSELLQGETLRARLAARPLPQRKAVEYAVQIARGLAAAHDRGIVHRDLKPENVFLTRDGHVKILDFGLVRLTGNGPDIAATDSPTLSRSGVVMGTVGYMSPEQVRGHPADERSDLFAFGAILYEMLAGHRAFQGDTPVEMMTATLRQEPPELPATVPPALSRLVWHCLEKKPEERFRSAHDLAFDLEALAEPSSAGSRGALPLAAKSGRKTAPLLLALFLAVAAVAGAALARWLWHTSPSPPVFRQLTFRRGSIFTARFAPDGGTIVYGATWDGNPFQTFTTRTENPASSPLALSSNADLLAVSRSGEVALSLGRSFRGTPYVSIGTLATAPLLGGTPREILHGVHQADWAPDGSSLAVVLPGAGSGESRIEYPIGTVLLRSPRAILGLRVSPGGDLVAAFEELSTGFGLVVFNRAGQRKLTLPLGPNYPMGLAWHPSGEEIWYNTRTPSGGDLRAVRLDGSQRWVYRSTGWTTLYDISKDGRVLLGNHFVRLGIAGRPPGEARERDLSHFETSLVRDLSDDGRTLLFDEQGLYGNSNGVYLRALDGSPPVHLGAGRARSLSPDGKWALAWLPSSLVLLPTGAGEPRPLPKTIPDSSGICSWFPDGRRILCASRGSGSRPSRFYEQDLASGRARAVTPPGFGFSYVYGGNPLSPDGRQVVATDPEGRLWICPLDGERSRPPRAVAGVEPGDDVLRWSGDGRSLFLWRRDSVAAARVFRLDLATGRREPWIEVHPPDPGGIFTFTSFVLTPDGRSYAYTYGRLLTDLYLAEGLR